MGVLPWPPIGLLAAQPPPLPYAGCAMLHSQKKGILFYLFALRSIPMVFSLTNSYGMHLVILAHLSLFWMVCHSNMTFPPKELERESQNKLPPSLHCQTIPSLTSDPWPITPVLARYKWVVHKPCACSAPMCVSLRISVAYFLTLCGVDESGSSFFTSNFFSGLGLTWSWALSSSIWPLFSFTASLWAD